MGDFALHSRKNFPYLPRNELHSAFNRKISSYFTFTGYLVKGKNSYLRGERKTIAGRVFEYLKGALILAKIHLGMYFSTLAALVICCVKSLSLNR